MVKKTKSKQYKSGPITLEEAIVESLNTPELINQYQRLTGSRLIGKAPIDLMVDRATGYDDTKEWFKFFDFVKNYIWIPVLLKAKK